MYPTPNVTVTPYSQTVNYGGTASISVLVDTTNKSVYPTGTVTFFDPTGAPVATPTCTNAKDSSGNFACQVAGTFTVNSGGSINVKYSGDTNYPSSFSSAYINMPDFQISPVQGGVQLTAGQSQNLTINFNSVSGLSGTVVNLACSGLPAETTCTFNPTQLTMPSNGSVPTTLTISTTAIGQSSRRAANDNRGKGWAMAGTMLLFGMGFIALPWRRRGRLSVVLGLCALLVFLPSCGGGGGVAPNPVPSISSLNPTQVAAGSQIQNLYINGSNFMSSSTVTYNGVPHNSSLQSPTQIQIALGQNDVANTGQYPVIVTNPTPGGGPSPPVNFAVVTGTPTGNFNFTMTASVGAITHTTTLSLTVQ